MMPAAIAGQLSWIPDGTAWEQNIFSNSMGWVWRPRPELNRGVRFCRPLRNHSATWPHATDLLQTIKGLGNLLGPVGRQFLKSGFKAEMALPPRRDCQQRSLSPARQVSPARQSPGHDDFPEKARRLAGLFLEAGSDGRGHRQLK